MSEAHQNTTRKNAIVSTIAIFLSRIMGLVREQVFAFAFGAGAHFDAFIVAFRIPNLLRDLFAEGALSQSFVAIFSGKLSEGHKDDAYELANRVASFIFIVIGFWEMFIITLFRDGILIFPWLILRDGF